MREIKFIPNISKHAHGSVLACFGDTKVLCTVMMEDGVPHFLRGKEQGWLTAEYAMLPASTHKRKVRAIKVGKPDARATEIQRLIGRSLRMALDFSRLGERTLHVDCDVIQADGSTRTTAISGSFLALRLAIDRLMAQGYLEENPIISHVAAVSVGIIQQQIHVDIDFDQDSRADVDCNLVMDDQGNFIEFQASAEGKSFSPDELQRIIEKGQEAIDLIFKEQERVYENHRDSYE